jgi:hypothetical protein
VVQQFLGFEESPDFRLAVRDLALGHRLEFGALEQQYLVAPEFQGFTRPDQLLVDLGKKTVTRHQQLPSPALPQKQQDPALITDEMNMRIPEKGEGA